MDKIFKFRVIVTTPYLRRDKVEIQKDFEGVLKVAIEQIIRDNLESLNIVGLGVNVIVSR